jgi:hypothetical protein
MKLKYLDGTVTFECPGCGSWHCVPVEGARKWTWNGSVDLPSLVPSLMVTWDYGDPPVHRICHTVVTDGKIAFQHDCTHELRGQTVAMLEIADPEQVP